MKEEKYEKDRLRDFLNVLFSIAVVITLSFIVLTFVGQRTVVVGNSMSPTLQDQDSLILEKVSCRIRDPKRFEVVVFRFDAEKDLYYIKRVVGLPGETVQIVSGKILINGEVMEENYGAEPMQEAGIAAEPVVLGENEYFVLGDNRNDSSDSRDPRVGKVNGSQIIGQAWLRIWPIAKFGFVK